MKVALPILLSDEERQTLSSWSWGRSTPARLVLRAKIILAAAAGVLNKDISEECGTSKPTVAQWRMRFAKLRLAGTRPLRHSDSRLHSSRHHYSLRGFERGGRSSNWRMHAATSTPGMDQVSQTDRCRHRSGLVLALDRGQLRHA